MKFTLSSVLVALIIAAVGCGDDDPAAPAPGDLEIVTVTTGENIDTDGYELTIDGEAGPAIGANATVTREDVSPGAYLIQLGDVALNCTVQGDNPRTVDVLAGQTATTQFDVVCEGPPPNQPPVADAGMDQTVVDVFGSGAVNVTLDGSGSSDVDGTITSYSWIEADVVIATGQMPSVSFALGVHTVTLRVRDDENATDTDDVIITVEAIPGNQSPVADAGADQTVVDTDGSGSEDVMLDGSGSMDPDGTIVMWSWSESSMEIATDEMPTEAFAVGAHMVTLTVTDDEGATGTDDVMITVEAPALVSFATQIQPYFTANCVACHNGGTGQKGVNLDTYANILTDGDNGPLVVPGNSADASAILIPKLNANHNDGPDDAGFVVTLSQWVDEGAQDN